MGSGIRNIMRYAPLYFPEYEVEILNGSHFIFSMTYIKISHETDEDVLRNIKMSYETDEDLQTEELNISLNYDVPKREKKTRHKRHRYIIKLIHDNPKITIDEISILMDVNERTIRRDIVDLKDVIEHVGPKKGGSWRIKK